MLIKFEMADFRTFKDFHELHMKAGISTELQETNTCLSGISMAPRLVRVALIYGAPAAGKSHFIAALAWMREQVLYSVHMRETIELLPGHMEIFFVAQNIGYRYGFITKDNRVIEEWLEAYPAGRSQLYFQRQYVAEQNQYEWKFGREFERSVQKLQFCKEFTRPHMLFLSTALLLDILLLKPGYHWFEGMDILTVSTLTPNKTLKRMQTSEGKLQVQQWMRAAGIRESEDYVKSSGGVQRLFSLAGHWLEALEKGGVLWVDDLDHHMHPLISQFLIRCICHPKMNPHHVQLIATTRDTALMDKAIMRRDQIWFVEKNSEENSRLYPLMDFQPRLGADIQKSYLQGKYGAIPMI